MKIITLFFSLFLSIVCLAGTETPLIVEQEGLAVEVVDFEEGDKLKLFEVETGDHILSKSYAYLDLSQLPVGSYRLENNQGKSVIIDRLEEELKINGAAIIESNEFFLEEDSEEVYNNEDIGVVDEREFIQQYENPNRNNLSIIREGDVITVVDFEEGDKIKLFEVEDTVHVLSKTTNIVDMTLLPVGVYLLENNRGDSVVVEKKFIEVEAENTIADM